MKQQMRENSFMAEEMCYFNGGQSIGCGSGEAGPSSNQGLDHIKMPDPRGHIQCRPPF